MRVCLILEGCGRRCLFSIFSWFGRVSHAGDADLGEIALIFVSRRGRDILLVRHVCAQDLSQSRHRFAERYSLLLCALDGAEKTRDGGSFSSVSTLSKPISSFVAVVSHSGPAKLVEKLAGYTAREPVVGSSEVCNHKVPRVTSPMMQATGWRIVLIWVWLHSLLTSAYFGEPLPTHYSTKFATAGSWTSQRCRG